MGVYHWSRQSVCANLVCHSRNIVSVYYNMTLFISLASLSSFFLSLSVIVLSLNYVVVLFPNMLYPDGHSWI